MSSLSYLLNLKDRYKTEQIDDIFSFFFLQAFSNSLAELNVGGNTYICKEGASNFGLLEREDDDSNDITNKPVDRMACYQLTAYPTAISCTRQ